MANQFAGSVYKDKNLEDKLWLYSRPAHVLLMFRSCFARVSSTSCPKVIRSSSACERTSCGQCQTKVRTIHDQNTTETQS